MAQNKKVPPKKALTPMLKQYMEIKNAHPDALLFYRMGDFYELFFEDALEAAPLLEVQLTSRDKNASDPIPMCGIPHHALQNYLFKLVEKGKKVAICEQVEKPGQSKGVLKRAVSRIVTPALIADPDLTNSNSKNYLAYLNKEEEEFEVGFFDLLSGEIRHGKTTSYKSVKELFLQFQPKELLVTKSSLSKKWVKEFAQLFSEISMTPREEFTGGSTKEILDYVRETQKVDNLSYLQKPLPLFDQKEVRMDPITVASLEILQTIKGESHGPTLLNVTNLTYTPMGRRLLKEWLSRPSTDFQTVTHRHESVEELLQSPALCDKVSERLQPMRDLERLNAKNALGLASPKDLGLIRNNLELIPKLKKVLKGAKSSLLRQLAEQLKDLKSLEGSLASALVDEPPVSLSKGGIIRESFNKEVARLRKLSLGAKSTIASMEQKERTNTGIANLKIKFSKVFGYTIEVTKTHLDKVPSHYIRKQTIANGERFITDELKRFELEALSADSKLRSLEEELFLSLRTAVQQKSMALASNAAVLAQIDVLLSFARVSSKLGYTRPEMHRGWELEIRSGRHPVVETVVEPGTFVPNDIVFEKSNRTWILTGPNMAGKSTVMRQAALISVLAQAGCFVPAESAKLPLLDAVYTRIGSSDDLASGRSTFMVEMMEIARILNEATPASLILVDEIGRGTSTYDGLALAWALVEHINQQIKSKTLFATHFHEVTALEGRVEGIANANVLVKRWKGEIIFLHKLARGACNKSYGIEVAGLAKLPAPVLDRAQSLLAQLESGSAKEARKGSGALASRAAQMSFF